jgi:hypothetical protein
MVSAKAFAIILKDTSVTPPTCRCGNTGLVNGEWVPTFPKMITICSKLEWEYATALADGDEHRAQAICSSQGFGTPVRIPLSGTFDDSMRPLEKTGRVRLVEVDSQEVLPGIRFLPASGHRFDYVAIALVSEGHRAVFGGDVMYSPWNSTTWI